MLANYTWSKWLSTSDTAQTSAEVSAISPYQLNRNYSLSEDDNPQVFNASLVYSLPVGKGERFMNRGGILDSILGGWQVSTIFTLQSGSPFGFDSSYCNVPSQFAAGCIPATLPGANSFARSKGSFNPGVGPIFNARGFQSASSFNFNFGEGPRVSNILGFGYHDQDFGPQKTIQFSEQLKMEFRGEFYNAWNWHSFRTSLGPFITDVASATFSAWTGAVTPPRNIQVALRFLF